MGRAQRTAVATASALRRGSADNPKNVEMTAWLDADTPQLTGRYAVGGWLRLRGAGDDVVERAHWHQIEAGDPIRAIEGLSYLEKVEPLSYGLYRAVFSDGSALVDTQLQRVAIARVTVGNEHAAVAAALGHEALYDTTRPTVRSRALAATYYRLGEGAPSGEDYAAVAKAASALLRDRGGHIQINPTDLIAMLIPAITPADSETVRRLEDGEDEAFDEVWGEYLQAAEQLYTNGAARSELEAERLSRYETAICRHEIRAAVLQWEAARQALVRELLGRPPAPVSGEALERMAVQSAETLHAQVRGVLENDPAASDSETRELSRLCAQNEYCLYLATELADGVRAGVVAGVLERILPSATRKELEGASPARARSALATLTDDMYSPLIFANYLAETGSGTYEIDWARLRRSVADDIAVFINL